MRAPSRSQSGESQARNGEGAVPYAGATPEVESDGLIVSHHRNQYHHHGMHARETEEVAGRDEGDEGGRDLVKQADEGEGDEHGDSELMSLISQLSHVHNMKRMMEEQSIHHAHDNALVDAEGHANSHKSSGSGGTVASNHSHRTNGLHGTMPFPASEYGQGNLLGARHRSPSPAVPAMYQYEPDVRHYSTAAHGRYADASMLAEYPLEAMRYSGHHTLASALREPLPHNTGRDAGTLIAGGMRAHAAEVTSRVPLNANAHERDAVRSHTKERSVGQRGDDGQPRVLKQRAHTVTGGSYVQEHKKGRQPRYALTVTVEAVCIYTFTHIQTYIHTYGIV